MHAWLCENPTGIDALQWKEMPTPQPGKGEVLIEIKAASLNFPDLLIVQNKYQMKPPLPFVPGSEYAGLVQAVGDGVTQLQVGQSVACLSGTGGFAKKEPKADAAAMAELVQWYAQGKIKPVIDSTMPMADLKAAYARMGSRGVKGKLVMVN